MTDSAGYYSDDDRSIDPWFRHADHHYRGPEYALPTVEVTVRMSWSPNDGWVIARDSYPPAPTIRLPVIGEIVGEGYHWPQYMDDGGEPTHLCTIGTTGAFASGESISYPEIPVGGRVRIDFEWVFEDGSEPEQCEYFHSHSGSTPAKKVATLHYFLESQDENGDREQLELERDLTPLLVEERERNWHIYERRY